MMPTSTVSCILFGCPLSLKRRDRLQRKLTRLIEQEGILILLHVLGGSGLIQEQRVHPPNVLHLHFCALRKEAMHPGEGQGCRHIAPTSAPRVKPAYLPFATHKSGGADQLDGVAQRRFHPDARQDSVSLFTHLHILLLTAASKPNTFSLLLDGFNRDSEHRISPDLQDLSGLFLGVRRGGDDEQAIQQVDGDAVGALIVGATDAEQSPAVNIHTSS